MLSALISKYYIEFGRNFGPCKAHLLAVEIADVDELVGVGGTLRGGAAAHSEGHDQVHGAVLGLPVGTGVGSVLGQQRSHIAGEQLRHLQPPISNLLCPATTGGLTLSLVVS